MFRILFILLFIIGTIIAYFNKRIVTRIKKNNQIKERFKQLYLKEDISNELERFYCKKIKFIGYICIGFGLMGCAYTFSLSNSKEIIDKIKKPEFSIGSERHSLKVVENSIESNIDIDVPAFKYTKSEAKQICDSAYEEWVVTFCNKNKSLDYITSDVKLTDSILGYDVNFEYYISEDSYLDYDGRVCFDDAKYYEGKCNASIEVYCSIDEYDYTYELKYTLIEPNKTLEDKIQEYVNNQNVYDEYIYLPEKIDGKQIEFIEEENDETAYIIFFAAIIAVIVVYRGKDRDVMIENKKREEQMRLDYAEIVFMFSILQQSGQSIRNTWFKIVENYMRTNRKRYAYEEMKIAKNKIVNGVSERQAYKEFAKRCKLQDYIKFVNVIEQNLSKGSNSMKNQLEMEVLESSRNKVALAKQKAEECSTKLLVPMIMMLIIVVVILIIPAFLNISF